ncbi:hypothetical protein BGZ46_009918 [Entomortierella lignicola]|nr:hypothetical protein BGZ46_009918 [Entomortierella lignicola]
MNQQEICSTLGACSLSLSSTPSPSPSPTPSPSLSHDLVSNTNTDTITATLQTISITNNNNNNDTITTYSSKETLDTTTPSTPIAATAPATLLPPPIICTTSTTSFLSKPSSESEYQNDSNLTSPITTSSTSSIPSTPTTATPTLNITPPLSISTNIIRLGITSDTTCPWCFITKRRIFKAIEIFHSLSLEASKVEFDIQWHSYQLHAQASLIPGPKAKHYERKFGSEKAKFVRTRVSKAGRNEGIEFRTADNVLYCNTLNSHRLIRYARERMARRLYGNRFGEGVGSSNSNSSSDRVDGEEDPHNNDEDVVVEEQEQEQQEQEEEEEYKIDYLGNFMEDAMVEELFQSHFLRGECGDLPTLNEIARKVLLATTTFLNKDSIRGVEGEAEGERGEGNSNHHSNINNKIVEITNTKDEYQTELEQELVDAEEFLLTDEYLDEIKEEIRVAKKDLGIQGVPAIIVQNTYLLSGGQDPSTFVEVFKRVV